MKVLVLDPGESVGWATAEINDGAITVLDHGITPLWVMAKACYRAIVVERTYDVVVMESWQLSPAHATRLIGDHMLSSQFIGAVRLCCQLADVKLVMQRPADMYGPTQRSLDTHPMGADIRERIAKLPKSHDESHDGSALLHLWRFFFKRYA